MEASGAQPVNSDGMVRQPVMPTAGVNLVPEKKMSKKRKVLIGAISGTLVVIVGVVVALAIMRPWESEPDVADEVELTEDQLTVEEYKAKVEEKLTAFKRSIIYAGDADEEADGELELNLNEVDTATGTTYRTLLVYTAVGFYQEYIDETEGAVKAGLLKARLEYMMSEDLEGEFACQCLNDAVAIDDIEQTVESARLVISVASAYGYKDSMNEYTEILYQRQVENGDDVEMETIG